MRYTLTACRAVELCSLLRPTTILPVHYDGWSHFHQGYDEVAAAFAAARTSVRDSVRWLTPGLAADVTI
jgi:L-ascorbate metabolism protein UlaG (beta-lactamase superfamily)